MASFSEASHLRDDLAHDKVVNVIFDDSAKGHYLLPSDYNSGRNFPFMSSSGSFPFNIMRGKYRYTSVWISSIEARFHSLREAICKYISHIVKVDGILPPIREKQLRQNPQKSE